MKKLLAIVLAVMMLAVGVAVAVPAAVTSANNDGALTITKELDSYTDEDGDGFIEVGEETSFVLIITVTNTHATEPITDVVVKDRLGADLEVDGWVKSTGTVTTDTKGNSDKVFLSWDVGDLGPEASATLTLTVSTDIDPGGEQEYTEPGIQWLNSGANAKGRLEGKQVSDDSDPISIDVAQILLLVEKDPSDWTIVSGGASGELSFYIAGPTFDFVFNSDSLEANTGYSLIYYADPWPGDGLTHSTGALIATMTTDANGDVSTSGSVELNTDMPNPNDANHPGGAKIWLVPSSHYSTTTPGAQGHMIGWQPTRYLFEHNLILYNDTDI